MLTYVGIRGPESYLTTHYDSHVPIFHYYLRYFVIYNIIN